jgi:outer membrane lipoprotein SlyB
MKITFVIASVLMAAALTGTLSTSAFASDGGDESETNTEQALKQKNVGSGESTNFNCGENTIDGGFIDAQLCGTADIGDGGGDGIGRVTLCHNPEGPSPQTLSLPVQAVPAHLAHGDHLGRCAA